MDCLEGMTHIPDGSIDAIICDLPYGTTECAWDSVIPFDQLWEQYKRIIKHGGPIVLFGSEPFSTMLRMSNLEWFKYDWIWIKNRPNGYLEAKNKPMKAHEIISICSSGSSSNGCLNRITYNPQGIVPCDVVNKNREGNIYGNRKNREVGKTFKQEFTNYPTSILKFTTDDDDRFHPTQKPVDLLRYLIRTYSNEGDTILDNCMGSGTTAVACIKEKRHFIGFELNKEYYDKACQRIDAEQRQLSLF
jgi:site-specific DNA-methyltransferase (adenine-specific)